MKSIRFLFTAVCALMTLAACKSDEVGVADVTNDDPDYLIMVYGVGGGNLDSESLLNIRQLLSEGSDSKVKYTVQYKLSADQQEWYEGTFDGVRRFTGDANLRLQDPEVHNPDYEMGISFDYRNMTEEIVSERIGDAQYDMCTGEALADFINWSKQKYSKARHTILVLKDHGSGWTMHHDAKKDVTTRGILFDDNLNRKFLSLNDVTSGIKSAGGVDVIYTDACLMSMYENLYGYADACKYALTSMQPTPAKAGDYIELLSLLKSAGASEAEMVSAMQKYADHCTSRQWWGRITFNADLSVFDMEKLKTTCTPVLKRIADTLADKFVSDESIQPTTDELVYGDTFAPYIRVAVKKCMVAYYQDAISKDSISNNIKPYLEKDKVLNSEEGYFTHSLFQWAIYGSTEAAKEAQAAYPEEFRKLQIMISNTAVRSFSLTDMMRVLCRELDRAGAKNNPFAQLREELLTAIRAMSYIACVHDNFSDPAIDEKYELCSPGIFIAPLNELLLSDYFPLYKGFISSVEDGVRCYQTTAFDQQVGWSNFLKVLDVVPDASNPTKDYVK